MKTKTEIQSKIKALEAIHDSLDKSELITKTKKEISDAFIKVLKWALEDATN